MRKQRCFKTSNDKPLYLSHGYTNVYVVTVCKLLKTILYASVNLEHSAWSFGWFSTVAEKAHMNNSRINNGIWVKNGKVPHMGGKIQKELKEKQLFLSK